MNWQAQRNWYSWVTLDLPRRLEVRHVHDRWVAYAIWSIEREVEIAMEETQELARTAAETWLRETMARFA